MGRKGRGREWRGGERKGGKESGREGRGGDETTANSTPVLVFQKIPRIREGCDLPLDISHRGPALCEPPPEWQDPGFLQTKLREVAAVPHTLLLHTCKNISLTQPHALPCPVCPGG